MVLVVLLWLRGGCNARGSDGVAGDSAVGVVVLMAPLLLTAIWVGLWRLCVLALVVRCMWVSGWIMGGRARGLASASRLLNCKPKLLA